MVLSIDEVNDILDRVYDEFPEALFQGKKISTCAVGFFS